MKQSYETFPMDKAKGIRMLILDIDGVMTSGEIFIADQGEQIKAFNVRDGHGIKLLQRSGIEVAVLTGRTSQVVEHRCRELGIQYVMQGCLRKGDSVQELCEKSGIQSSACAYMGDDVIDLPAMAYCHLSFAPSDAYVAVLGKVDWVSGFAAGAGAVRQACEGLMIANEAWDEQMTRTYGVFPHESGWQ
ncbi:MAG: HAD-IIIA family hydrolase [Mariprofundaceae bacterium]|nr:HAD-IIIA family hydrolase [Mariprofundaceae bacterium]